MSSDRRGGPLIMKKPIVAALLTSVYEKNRDTEAVKFKNAMR